MSHNDPEMLFWTTNTQTVHQVGDRKFVSPSPMSFLSVADVCVLLPLMWLLFPCSSLSHFLFSLSGGKWILLLFPISCVRSDQNGQETRFVTGEGCRPLILLHHCYHRHSIIKQDKCQYSRTGMSSCHHLSCINNYQLLVIKCLTVNTLFFNLNPSL